MTKTETGKRNNSLNNRMWSTRVTVLGVGVGGKEEFINEKHIQIQYNTHTHTHTHTHAGSHTNTSTPTDTLQAHTHMQTHSNRHDQWSMLYECINYIQSLSSKHQYPGY